MSDEVIDSLFMFIRKKLQQRSDLCRWKFVIADIVVTEFLRRHDDISEEFKKVQDPSLITFDWSTTKTLMDYVMGRHSDHDAHWSTVDAIYNHSTSEGNHWVMVCVDL